MSDTFDYNKRAETLRRTLNSLPVNEIGSSSQDSETSSNDTTQDVPGLSGNNDSRRTALRTVANFPLVRCGVLGSTRMEYCSFPHDFSSFSIR